MDAWPATNPFASVVAVGAMLPRVVLPPPPPPPLLLLLPPQLTLVPKATASTNVDRATTQRWRTGNRSKSNKKSARDAHTPAASQFGVCGVGARGKVTLCVGVVKVTVPPMFAPELPTEGLPEVALSKKAVMVICWPDGIVVGGVVMAVAVLHFATLNETTLEFGLAL